MLQGYRDLKDEFPGLERKLVSKKKAVRFFGRGSELGGNGVIKAEIAEEGGSGGSKKKNKLGDCFVKATHLLEPVTYMRGEYEKNEDKRRHKLGEPMNQAYVDCLASWAVSKIREAGNSPHFCDFYGYKVGCADKYYYNMSDEFEDYKYKRWFWENKEKGLFDFKVFIGEDRRPIPEELKEYFDKPNEEELCEDEDKEKLNKKPAIEIDELRGCVEIDAEEIRGSSGGAGLGVDELGECKSVSSDDMKFEDADDAEHVDNDEEEEGSSSSESEQPEEEIEIYAEIPNFPVMLICMEKNEDTMDSLLLEEEFEKGWEKRWMAWIFQVVCALTQLQNMLDMTHNDLHTNNILWKETGEQFIYYRHNGKYWKVPTYGKVFRIIDFGRAIFKSPDGKIIYSDDFLADNDAAGQYNFGPFYNDKETIIEPNKSFDLVRLATGLYEELFEDEKPEKKEDGKMLSEEEGMIVWETNSRLHDMLWSWLIDDEGRNVLIKPNGDERFPGFDLYQHIAKHCREAVPEEQFERWFSEFEIDAGKVKGKTAYPLGR